MAPAIFEAILVAHGVEKNFGIPRVDWMKQVKKFYFGALLGTVVVSAVLLTLALQSGNQKGAVVLVVIIVGGAAVLAGVKLSKRPDR